MKKFMVYALSTTLALGAAMPVFAESVFNDVPIMGVPIREEFEVEPGFESENFPFMTPGIGAVALPTGKTAIITDMQDDTVTVKGVWGNEEVVILTISRDTVIIDATTGFPATLDERLHDRVHVTYGPIMGMSYPPVSPARMIAVNMPEDADASPNYHVIEAIEEVDEDTIRILTDNGGLFVTLTRETPLMPHLTREMLHLEMLEVGDTVVLWYGIVLTSFPGQTWASRALRVRRAHPNVADGNEMELGYLPPVTLPGDISGGYDRPITIPGEIESGYETPPSAVAILRFAMDSFEYTLNGETRTAANKSFIHEFNNAGRAMVPIRNVAEAFGGTPVWESETSTAVIYLPGRDAIRVQANVPLPNNMGYAINNNGTIFVPLAFVSHEFGGMTNWDGVARVAEVIWLV